MPAEYVPPESRLPDSPATQRSWEANGGWAAEALRLLQLPGPWIRLVAGLAFVLMVLATATRVSPPTALSGVRRSNSGQPWTARAASISPDRYAWLTKRQAKAYASLADRIETPEGWTRVKASPGSFAAWLRHLPVAPEEAPVKSGKGKVVLPAADPSLAAVIALQPHSDRLLAGPNMLIRLRAEYVWSSGRLSDLGFHFTNGDFAAWERWEAGDRPTVRGREVSWSKVLEPDESRTNYCAYLESLFQYSSGYSLLADTTEVRDGSIAAGDIFLRNGRESCSLIVVDAATSKEGRLAVLIGRSDWPAQSFHIVRCSDGSAWAPVAQNRDLALTNGLTARLQDLRRWK